MNDNIQNNIEKSEVEAKFVCPDELNLDSLLEIINKLGFKCTSGTPCLQSDVYLDTPDYKLVKSDAAIRIRRRGENYVGAFKTAGRQQGAIFERREVEWTLSAEEIKLWNGEKRPTIPPAVANELDIEVQTLRKALVVETNRNTAIINSNDGLKAELSLDDVSFRGHKGQKQYREIEVELLDGQFEQFQHLTDALQSHLKLQPAVDSKYRKGMMLVGKYGV
ncbi:MAG TPA: CYTH domain-containing protein [Candidatus Wujingus californicus]|uniref:CYTH domain-containing protein n=2 Tax=Candidatus Wujingus californicus TaxID=3367618 RepID=UPI001D1B2EB9|nr:CYTH domain-containing protein [Planctomycetota bacterium]MDO8131371.1 CYTH domain-containing protein [Candidatus Brocadiales bacterium]